MIRIDGGAILTNQKGNITLVVPKNTKSIVLVTRDIIESPTSKINITLEPNAKLTFITIQNSNNVEHEEYRISQIGAGSKLKWIDYCLGSTSVKRSIEDNLNERDASVEHVHLFSGSDKQMLSFDLKVNHNASHTRSNIITHGILSGSARSNTHTIIKVKEGASKSTTSQKDNILLLSSSARADSLPQLEVNEEDVSCSHGAAIGRINQEHLFYLMSRGLSKQEAKKRIVMAFFEPIISELKEEKLACGLRNSVMSKLSKKL